MIYVLLVFSQIRHGAATALREVIKHHGDTAGISAYTPEPNVRYDVQQTMQGFCMWYHQKVVLYIIVLLIFLWEISLRV